MRKYSNSLTQMGFGFVEVGSITPKPQSGNPKPRLFRLSEDNALINRMGFNSGGLSQARQRLEKRVNRRDGIVGVNLGKNKDGEAEADYGAGVRALAPYADYLVINVSSPNTPGLRALRNRSRSSIHRLPWRSRARRESGVAPPLLLKLAPDLAEEELRAISAVAAARSIDGLIIGNTTIGRPSSLHGPHVHEAGGLSGAPLYTQSTEVLRLVYRLTEGRMPLIGVGGISSGKDAYGKIRAGASLVQLYTALVYQGPGLLQRLKNELAQLLRRDGFASMADAVGADHRVRAAEIAATQSSSAAPGQVQTIAGLREIAGAYDVYLLDLWGVLHNGVSAFPAAIAALRELKAAGKHIGTVQRPPACQRRRGTLGGTGHHARSLRRHPFFRRGNLAGAERWRRLGGRPRPPRPGRSCRRSDRSPLNGLDLDWTGDPAAAGFALLRRRPAGGDRRRL